ncbi:hypothetical protein TD95_001370 [Thielaviopsis punctulata]|uniref:Mechanosensitive ion channel protein n=1 Tax=Thielaviopsis punctulata TaxID=72032 RepID=A0A0F4ZIK2_9PEZI|nr:hypothetical protein TD95_001370 [Thielaviopsis punctulata]
MSQSNSQDAQPGENRNSIPESQNQPSYSQVPPPPIVPPAAHHPVATSGVHLSPISPVAPVAPSQYVQQQQDLHAAGVMPTLGMQPLAPTTTQRTEAVAYSEARRSHETRLHDELEMLRTEQIVSSREQELYRAGSKMPPSPPDDDDTHYNPNGDAILSPSKPLPQMTPDKNAPLYRLWMWLKKFPRLFRYVLYAVPGAALLLIPILLGKLAFDPGAHPIGGDGGVYLEWFGIWLEVMWGSLWVSRMATSLMPHLFKGVASMMGSINSKKWQDIGRELELHTALFLWMLSLLICTNVLLNNHRVPSSDPDNKSKDLNWIKVVIKVIISLFVLACLNLLEKVCIQWIAASFHQRTYAVRIVQNKDDVSKLVKLYEHSKSHFHPMDSIWHPVNSRPNSSGYRTPMQTMRLNARAAWDKFGNVAGRIGNDFMGRKTNGNHPRKVVSELLRNANHSRALARILYRSLKGLNLRTNGPNTSNDDPGNQTIVDDDSPETDTQNGYNEKNVDQSEMPNFDEEERLVYLEDFKVIFEDEEEAEAAFSLFDKDMNGDISMEEFEGVCYEIHLEKKAIAASLKDLDSVINKLDRVLFAIILIISVLVFVSIISGSAAAALTSAGTTILGLSWLLQATTQEFLQSIIFVFVKHPFDVGDRVTVYGNSGTLGRGDDYYVTEISLWYTEFKKMEGHIVQAPNSILNTLFILNQRRSNALADVVSLQVRFGTTQIQIEKLKERMLNFVDLNRRDYQSRILTEMRTLDNMQSATLNFIFFHKSNFQNELLRLSRHNRFLTELMQQMCEVGIQPPFKSQPGGSKENPVYWRYLDSEGKRQAAPFSGGGRDGPDDYNTSPHGMYRRPDNEPRDHDYDGQDYDRFRRQSPTERTSSDNRSASERLPTLRQHERFDDFQDVYSMRKNERPNRWNSVTSGGNNLHNHLAQLRMRKGSTLPVDGHSLALQDSYQTGSYLPPRSSVDQGSMHGIKRMTTTMSKMSSSSRRFWPRPRAPTQSGNKPPDVLPDGSLV